MSITLTVGATTVTLPGGMQWVDADDWHPVQQAVERSVTGALIIDVKATPTGRHISLQPVDPSAAWMPRADLDQLKAWAASAGLQMTLNVNGVPFTAIWRHHTPPALSATPVVFYDDAGSGDFYLVRMNLMDVTP